MSQPFDFQALAARAMQDNPDAALLDAIERKAEASRAWNTCRAVDRPRVAAQSLAAENAITNHRPETLEGLLTKLRWAAKKMHRAPAFEAQHSALLDAIAWLEPPTPPKPRRGNRAKGGAA